MNRFYTWLSASVLCLSMVTTADAASIKFDFGQADTPGNINSVIWSAQDVADAIDTTGASTGVSLTVTSATGFNEVGPNRDGTSTPGVPASNFFVGETTNDSLFGHSVNFNAPAPRPLIVYTIAGLNPALTYDFTFFASRMNVTDNREAQYILAGLNSAVVALDAANNVANIAQAIGVAPTAAGEIQLTVQAGPNNSNGSKFFYLGAMDINAVPEPASLCLMGLGSVLIAARRLA